MSRPINTASSDSEKIAVPPYLIISILTILAIGSQYFSNLSYILNQGVIQNGLGLSGNDLLLPSTLSNLAFALGVPLGPVLTRKLGLRRNYLTFVFIFLSGSIIAAVSPGPTLLIAGRVIQGVSAGMLFLTILPAGLQSFPNRIRNVFLFMVIAGLFGASALGAVFGALSLRADAWRWLFLLNVLASLSCLIIGYFGLPKRDPHAGDPRPVDKSGVFLLSLITATCAVSLCNLVGKGLSSLYVWPFFVVAFLLFLLFVYVDFKAETPLIPFRTLKAPKPFSGMVMAVASHASLLFAIAGINGFLRNDIQLPSRYLMHFYFWFFVGIVAAAILKTVFYDKLGPGLLGLIGSLAVIDVSLQWKDIGSGASLPSLYFQIAFLGAGVSMVLVSGALGAALAGELHEAPLRSVTLHAIRNFAGAVMSPIIGWFLTRQNAINYERIRERLDANDPEFKREMTGAIRHFMQNGMPLANARSTASYELVANAKKSATLGAYHDLFTILLILGVVMLIASIGKIATGKGRTLVQKHKPTWMGETGA